MYTYLIHPKNKFMEVIIIKPSNTMQRLNYLMTERNLKQKDILNLTQELCKKYDIKFNKSDISQYVSGKTQPNQDKLFILSEALNVNVAWLMGFDVSMEKPNTTNINNTMLNSINNCEYNSSTLEVIKMYEQLDIEDRAEIKGTIKGMLKSEKYSVLKNKLNA